MYYFQNMIFMMHFFFYQILNVDIERSFPAYLKKDFFYIYIIFTITLTKKSYRVTFYAVLISIINARWDLGKTHFKC